MRNRYASLTAAAGLAVVLAAVGVTPALASTHAAGPAGNARATAGKAAEVPGTGGPGGAADAAAPGSALALRQRAQLAARQLAGSITGTVASADHLPLGAICVSAIGASRSFTTGTSADGRFDIAGLAPGSYILEYRGCSASAHYLTRFSGNTAWQRAAAHVRVSAGQVRSVPTMVLRSAARSLLQPDPAAWQRALANSGRPLSAAAAAKTGKITGVVTGKGKKLRGICVEADPASGTGYFYGATTGKRGTYTIRGIRPGRYDVTFEPAFDCADNGNWLQQNYRGQNTPFSSIANVVKVTRGKTEKEINARLVQGGQISGTVTSRSGKLLSGICVETTGQVTGGFAGYEEGTFKGHYVFHALFPGEYSFEFSTGCNSAANYAPVFPRDVRIRHTDHRTVNARMPVGAVIRGIVRLGSSSGRPVSGICVTATDSSGLIEVEEATGGNGKYSIDSLGNGLYQVYFSPGCNNNGNYIPVTDYADTREGKVTGGIDAVLQPGAEIYGTVTNTSGQGLGGICIELAGPGSPNIPSSTTPDGSYLINQMSPGTYQLGFITGCGNSGNYAPYYYDDQSDPSLASPIAVATGSAHEVNATMRPGGELTGTVTDSRGRKLSDVCVGAATPFQAELGDAFSQLVFTQHGKFAITGLEAGQYYVSFGCGETPPYPYGNQWYPDAPTTAAAQLVSVAAGTTSGISAVLQPDGAIAGVVTGKSGKPLSGICVEPVTPGTDVSAAASLTPPVTNSHGVYRIPGLQPGRYDIQFAPCDSNLRYAAQWYRSHAAETSANAIRVRAGKTTGRVDARLSAGGTISGRVTGSDHKPLSNICPYAANSSGLYFGNPTGKAGTYQVIGLSTGRYTVVIGPCGDGNQNLVTVLRLAKVTAPRATTGVNATLVEGGAVSGTITTAGPAATPVANECAEIGNANPDNAGGLGFSGTNGTYSATGIAPGTYTVYFGNPDCAIGGPPDLAPVWYDNQQAQDKATTITVTAGHTTTGIDGALPLTGEITGTISKASGAALSGACVTAYPGNGSSLVVAVSRGSGDYSLIDLQPGRYRVEFSSGCGTTGYRTQWWNKATSSKTATVISVSDSEVLTGISASLARKG